MGMTSAEKMRAKRARERLEPTPSVTFSDNPPFSGVSQHVDSKRKNFHPDSSPHAFQDVDSKGEIRNAYNDRARALGKYAKFAATSPSNVGAWAWDVPIDEATGELLPPSLDLAAIRLERFALQSAARSILPSSRTANCLRAFHPVKIDGNSGKLHQRPQVWKSEEFGSCRYSKLLVCASVWNCPVCASVISQRRRAELARAIELHVEQGGGVYLLTLTTPHTQADYLGALLDSQKECLSQHFYGHRSTKELFKRLDSIGHIRALEVTHGRSRQRNNGWHPHYHILLFMREGIDLDDMRLAFYKRWRYACLKSGLAEPSYEHGVTVHGAEFASNYVSKWGLEDEMTKGHIRKAPKAHGETPFDLLRAYFRDRDRQAAALFHEYARCFKGKKQLWWSRGLKDHFQVQELDDEEAATQFETTAECLGYIEVDQWRKILKYDIRGEILELSRHSWESVQELLNSLS